MNKIVLAAAWLAFLAGSACAQTQPNLIGMSLTACGNDVPVLGAGSGGVPQCGSSALGSAAYVNTGTSGGTVPLLNGANTFSDTNTFDTGDLIINGGTATAGLATATSVGVLSSEAFASPAQGGTGVASPTAHSLVVTEGATAFNLLTATTAGRLIIDQGSGSDPAFEACGGDCSSISSGGAFTIGKVDGVAFPSAPSTSTVPVVTGTNQITYESVPNAALANSAVTIAGTNVSLGGSISTNTILSSIGSTQGDLLYYGSSAWAALGPGTAGQFLQTAGASENPQWASQAISFGWNSVNSVTVSGGYFTNNIGSIAADVYVPMPVAGTLKSLAVSSGGNEPGTGNTYIVTVNKNGSDTVVTCTVSATSDSCTDTTHSVTVAVGDDIALHVTDSGSPSNTNFGASFIVTTP